MDTNKIAMINQFKKAGIDITEDELGVAVRADTKEPKQISKMITNGDKEVAVGCGVVPEAYKEIDFDFDRLKSELLSKGVEQQFRIARFNVYEQVLSNIITSLKIGALPERSWLIGAPAGFGKIEFVVDALKLMIKQQFQTVPYITLSELADKKYLRECEITKNVGVRNAMKTDKFVEDNTYEVQNSKVKFTRRIRHLTEAYGWEDYINADVVFCNFTTVSSKEIESITLKSLLDIRGNKGLPTIVFMDLSLEAYTQNDKLREWIWEPILDRGCNVERYTTIKHVSTFRTKVNGNNVVTEFDLRKDLGM